jgi:hypothetical protein
VIYMNFVPITCRLYGIPTAIGGKGHTCGLSGFTKGKSYPTVNLDAIHQAFLIFLLNLSSISARNIQGLSEMVVPLSMALLTVYDEEYLGIESDEKKKDSYGEEDKKDVESDD